MSEEYSIPENHSMGSNWQSNSPNVLKLSNIGYTQRKTDNLDLLSWEWFTNRVSTKLREAIFHNMTLRVSKCGKYSGEHPTLEVLKFTDVTFVEPCYFKDSPLLKQIYF